MSKTTLEKYGIIIVLYFLSTESIPMTRYPFRESVGQRLLVKTEMPPQNTSDLEPPSFVKISRKHGPGAGDHSYADYLISSLGRGVSWPNMWVNMGQPLA